MRQKRLFSRLFVLLALVASIVWLYPIALIIINSFKGYNDMMQNFLSFPVHFQFDMYAETWVNFKFPLLMKNTAIYTVVTVLAVVIIAPMAAYKLARTKTKYSKLCFLLIILPMMVPFQTYMITLTKLVSVLQINATKFGYIAVSIGLCLPLAVFMTHGFVKNVPIELEECASIDGASRLRTYFCIVFPLLVPIVTTVAVIDTLAVWNDVLVNMLLVGGKTQHLNLQNALYVNFSTTKSDWEHALPGIVISMVPNLIFFVFMQKYIVEGITAGAVKG